MAASDFITKTRDGATVTYPGKLPKLVPPGSVLVHNHIHPVSRIQGRRNSRFWLRKPADHLVACACGWAPELETHYRVERRP